MRAQRKILPLLLFPQGLDTHQGIRKPIQVVLALNKERVDLLPCMFILRLYQHLCCLLQVLLAFQQVVAVVYLPHGFEEG